MKDISTFNRNKYIHITASVLGALIAISGLTHGIFEILQGNRLTETFIIQSIGPEQQRWLNGEESFTLLPNFLSTGIAAVLVSCIIVFWSISFMHKTYGPSIFLMLFIFLTLVGGGIVHILFFLPVLLFSRLIRKEISWRKKHPDTIFSRFLSANWNLFLLLTCMLFITALVISIFGIPGVSSETISKILSAQQLVALSSLFITFFAAIEKDIQAMNYSVL